MTNLLGGGIDIALVLESLRPGMEYSWMGGAADDLDALDWVDASPSPTEQDIRDEWTATVEPLVILEAQSVADSNTSLSDAQAVKGEFVLLQSAAKSHYAALSGGEKSGALGIFENDASWDAATTGLKLDTLRAIISLLIIAVAFLYIRTLGSN